MTLRYRTSDGALMLNYADGELLRDGCCCYEACCSDALTSVQISLDTTGIQAACTGQGACDAWPTGVKTITLTKVSSNLWHGGIKEATYERWLISIDLACSVSGGFYARLTFSCKVGGCVLYSTCHVASDGMNCIGTTIMPQTASDPDYPGRTPLTDLGPFTVVAHL